eukprot:104371_1
MSSHISRHKKKSRSRSRHKKTKSLSVKKLSLKQAYSRAKHSLSGRSESSDVSTCINKQSDHDEKHDKPPDAQGPFRPRRRSRLNLSLSADSSLKRAVEAEQNTRRLSLNREEIKQMMLKKKKNQKRVFDIALLIHENTGEYYKILLGPVIYEVFYGYIRFVDCQQYVQNDINVLNETAVLIDELQSDDIFQYFCNYSTDPEDVQKGVAFDFADVSRCQLYRFNNRARWDHHKRMQQNTSCDVFIVANQDNIPIYVFMDVDIDLIEQKIQFAEVHGYEKGDVHVLDQMGSRVMDFEVDQTFLFFKKAAFNMTSLYNFAPSTKALFKFAICYRFSSKYSRNIFYRQGFNIALATNEKDEFLYLLTDVEYDLLNKSIAYKSCQFYRNGDYNQLRECAKEVKCIDVMKIKPEGADQSKYNLSACRKCILFDLTNRSLWKAHIVQQKATQFDIATVTDDDDYQAYILFDVTVNCIDQVIEYKICEEFKVEHQRIIEHYGQLVTTELICDFTIQGMDEMQNIFLYQLNSHSNGNDNQTSKRRKKSRKSRKKKPNKRQDTMISRSDITQSRAQKKPVTPNDEMNDIWYAYMDIYCYPPDNAQQLKAFSRLQNQTKTLSYSESRSLYKYHMNRINNMKTK